jgi:hypothetical protein
MSFLDEERKALIEQFQEEVALEHKTRTEALNAPKEKPKSRIDEFQREAEIASLRQQVRTQFYLDNGYVPYTDSRGITHLIPPEEAARRQSRRRRTQRKPRYLAKFKTYQYFSYIFIVLFGVAIAYKIVY